MCVCERERERERLRHAAHVNGCGAACTLRYTSPCAAHAALNAPVPMCRTQRLLHPIPCVARSAYCTRSHLSHAALTAPDPICRTQRAPQVLQAPTPHVMRRARSTDCTYSTCDRRSAGRRRRQVRAGRSMAPEGGRERVRVGGGRDGGQREGKGEREEERERERGRGPRNAETEGPPTAETEFALQLR